MAKKSLSQLSIFLVLIGVATATFLYFKDSIVKFNIQNIASIDNLVAHLPKIEHIAEEIEKNITLPEPLRFNNGSPDVILTMDGVILWTNQQRRLNGDLGKLTANALLNEAAEDKLQDMFDNQYFDHYSPAGLGPSDFIDSVSYQYIKTGENLALGNFEYDQGLVQAWMDSPGHRENMLTPDFTEIGVAVGKGEFEDKTTWLAVQVFGRPVSDCPPVDENLKTTIDSNQINLNTLKIELDAAQESLNKNKPRGRNVNQNKIEEYNKLVEQYNSLANQYNTISNETQNYINQYNAQIKAFNDCANS